jgi:predicted AAA+ superfamily ATPase
MDLDGIFRYSEIKIREFLKIFPVVVIIGVRQAGKTTLSKKIVPNWYYVDMEDEDDFDRVSHDLKFFFTQYPRHVIIDEAQEYPALFRTLRGIIDKNPNDNGRYILTGSSNPELLNKISESLAGRVGIIELGTLKAGEFLKKPLSPFYKLFNEKLKKKSLPSGQAPIKLKQMLEFWLKGGYPKPLLKGGFLFYQQWMDNYKKTYINRDLAKLFPRLNRLAYRRFLSMLCQLSGTIINKRELGRAVEVNEKTIREYLEIAEGTFLFSILQSFEKNIKKSITKMPKGYIRDSGLLHHLIKITSLEDLYNHPIVGKSFEGFVISEISKGLLATMITNWNLYYYRTKNKAEIDLIIDGPFGILPIEIKKGLSVNRSKLKFLSQFIEEHNLPFGLVINQSETTEWLTENIFQLPVGWL